MSSERDALERALAEVVTGPFGDEFALLLTRLFEDPMIRQAIEDDPAARGLEADQVPTARWAVVVLEHVCGSPRASPLAQRAELARIRSGRCPLI